MVCIFFACFIVSLWFLVSLCLLSSLCFLVSLCSCSCVCVWLCCHFTLCSCLCLIVLSFYTVLFFVCVRLLLCAWDFHSTFWYNSRQLYWLCSLSYVCIWYCLCFHFATWLYSLHFKCFFQILLCSTISFYNDWIAIAVTRLCSSQFPLSSILSTCFSIVLFGRLLMYFNYFLDALASLGFMLETD